MRIYKHKNSLFGFLFVVCAVCFTACSKDDGGFPIGPHHGKETVAPGELVAVLDSASMTIDEFASAVSSSPMLSFAAGALGNEAVMLKNCMQTILTARRPIMDAKFRKTLGRDSRGGRQWRLETYTFSYTSLTPTGESVVLSGRVTFPNNTVDSINHKLDSYTLYSHMFLFSNEWVPSNGFTMMSARALYNSAVIEPDEQGFGIDQGKHSMIYISSNVRARQLADCFTAARKIMQQHGVELSEEGYTTNWGDSFAAAVAVAYARYYDLEASKEERDAIRLKSTFAAHGPYIYDDMMIYKNAHPEIDGMLPLFSILSLNALSTQQRYGYSMKDFAPSWVKNESYIASDGKEYSLCDAIMYCVDGFADIYQEKYPGNEPLNNIFADDMLTKDGALDLKNKKTQAMLKALGDQSVFDKWHPSTDIYMAHGEDDDIVPYSIVKDFYNTLCAQSSNSRIHWMEAKPLSKSMVRLQGTHIAMASEAMIWMMLSPEPKDMAMFYN